VTVPEREYVFRRHYPAILVICDVKQKSATKLQLKEAVERSSFTSLGSGVLSSGAALRTALSPTYPIILNTTWSQLLKHRSLKMIEKVL